MLDGVWDLLTFDRWKEKKEKEKKTVFTIDQMRSNLDLM